MASPSMSEDQWKAKTTVGLTPGNCFKSPSFASPRSPQEWSVHAPGNEAHPFGSVKETITNDEWKSVFASCPDANERSV